jgi:hypothetical protein
MENPVSGSMNSFENTLKDEEVIYISMTRKDQRELLEKIDFAISLLTRS